MLGKAHSACQNHLGLAVAAMSGKVAKVTNVSGLDRSPGAVTYTCSCGEPATWFLREIVDRWDFERTWNP